MKNCTEKYSQKKPIPGSDTEKIAAVWTYLVSGNRNTMTNRWFFYRAACNATHGIAVAFCLCVRQMRVL